MHVIPITTFDGLWPAGRAVGAVLVDDEGNAVASTFTTSWADGGAAATNVADLTTGQITELR